MCEPETKIEPHIDEPNLVALEMVRKFISPHSDELDESEGFLVGQLSLNQIPYRFEFNCNSKLGIVIRLQFDLVIFDDLLPEIMEFIIRSNSLNAFKFWDFDFSSKVVSLSHFQETENSKPQDFEDMCRIIFLTADATFPYLAGVTLGMMNPKDAAEISDSTQMEVIQELYDNISGYRERSKEPENP